MEDPEAVEAVVEEEEEEVEGEAEEVGEEVVVAVVVVGNLTTAGPTGRSVAWSSTRPWRTSRPCSPPWTMR